MVFSDNYIVCYTPILDFIAVIIFCFLIYDVTISWNLGLNTSNFYKKQLLNKMQPRSNLMLTFASRSDRKKSIFAFTNCLLTSKNFVSFLAGILYFIVFVINRAVRDNSGVFWYHWCTALVPP